MTDITANPLSPDLLKRSLEALSEELDRIQEERDMAVEALEQIMYSLEKAHQMTRETLTKLGVTE